MLGAIDSPGVPLITCNRCGKENQDHYKFCLGCGSELVKPAPAPAPVAPAVTPPVQAAAPEPTLETARTVLPPAPVGSTAAGELRTASPAAKSRGGIPWNDSPKMPAPIPFQLPPNPLASGVTPPPVVRPTSSGGASNGNGGPSHGNIASAAGSIGFTAGATPAPVRVTGPVVAAVSPVGELICPSCGKPVQPGFAFCGGCGTRIARQPSNAAPGGAPPQTMFMAGAPATAPVAVPRGRLILIRPDGSEGGAHPLHDGENIIGRGQAPLFDADAYLSPRHAEVSIGPGGVTIRDLQSLNGIFLKIDGEEPLESGDIFRIGQELLRFEVISSPQALEDGTEIMGTPNPGFWGRLSVIVGRDVDGSAFPLFGESIVLGRERGDILFPEDGYVSGTHSRISLHDERAFLTDLGSSNGTFLRIRHERTVPTGAFMLMGQQLFRLEVR
jgi:pSer/pThr/pTyr-binding forkhead associated (FHA) protein